MGGVDRGGPVVSLGRGETEFRDPVEPGKILLDFDPRGEQIDVLEGTTVILETLFPSSWFFPAKAARWGGSPQYCSPSIR